MKPFKFLSGDLTPWDVASWDFYQDCEEDYGDHRIDVEWYDDFITFLSRFDEHYTVLIDSVRIPYGPELNDYLDINHSNFDLYLDDFTAWGGIVRVTWLNFDIM